MYSNGRSEVTIPLALHWPAGRVLHHAPRCTARHAPRATLRRARPVWALHDLGQGRLGSLLAKEHRLLTHFFDVYSTANAQSPASEG